MSIHDFLCKDTAFSVGMQIFLRENAVMACDIESNFVILQPIT